MRNATAADYAWLYARTHYMANGLKCAREGMKWIQDQDRRLSIHDVGCGRGHFVRWAMQNGHLCSGSDPAINEAWPITQDGQPDVVTAFDVLEHLTANDARALLDHMLTQAREHVLFTVCWEPDTALVDGELVNLHITMEEPAWWRAMLYDLGVSDDRITARPCHEKTRHLFIVECA